MNFWRCFVFSILVIFLIPEKINAAAPSGFLDVANMNSIAGWARDTDFNGSIRVHIYIDGRFEKDITANQLRTDVGGNFGFSWVNPPLAPLQGSREIRAYALGVDSAGQLNGQNVELTSSPKYVTVPRYYTLRSPDNSVEVQVDAKMGGIISKLEDRNNLPGYNMILPNGGAGLQKAFWNPTPYPTNPPNCPIERTDVDYPNPTQGGYYADVVAGTDKGNPIGIYGTNGITDHNEFVRYENSNQTIHFKTRFINHSYCLQPEADMANRPLWDTEWYLEQWISFDSGLLNTLRVDSVISYVGNVTTSMDTRQTIGFTNGLGRVAYQNNHSTVITTNLNNAPNPFNPTNNWVAALHSTVNTGMGFILPANAQTFNFNNALNGLFSYEPFEDPLYPRLSFDRLGHIKLESIGSLVNAFTSNGGYIYTFYPGGTWSYRFWIPVGPVERIRAQAAGLMPAPTPTVSPTPTRTPTPTITPTPTRTPTPTLRPTVAGDYTGDYLVDFRDLLYIKDRYFTLNLSVFTFNRMARDFGK